MSLSFKEMTAVYATAAKPPLPLTESGPLAGKTVLEKLEKLYYLRQNGQLPRRPTTWPSEDKQCTIAVCLVIVDELYHEDIWRAWLEGARSCNRCNGCGCDNSSSGGSSTSYRARLFIHAKHPERIKSPWVRAHTLGITHSPEWNSPEVVRAMLSVLEAALRAGCEKRGGSRGDESGTDGSLGDDGQTQCGRFVFGTESCVPICSLGEAGCRLFATDKSWLNAFHTPKSSWENGACFRSVDSTLIPPIAVWKCIPGWMMLTRRHASEVAELALRAAGQDLVQAWGPGGQWSEERGGVFAPEEVFFPTMLALLGYLRDSGSSTASGPGGGDEVSRTTVTFAEWAKRGDANPINYEFLSPALLNKFKAHGALFARKFKKGTLPVAVWRKLVLGEAEALVNQPVAFDDVPKAVKAVAAAAAAAAGSAATAPPAVACSAVHRSTMQRVAIFRDDGSGPEEGEEVDDDEEDDTADSHSVQVKKKRKVEQSR